MKLDDELADSIKAIHGDEYDEMHPYEAAILDALSGPVNPLTGMRDSGEGIHGKLDRIEAEAVKMAQRVTDLHENGRVRFSKAFKIVGGSVVAGLFSILYLLLQHVLT